VSTKNGNSIYTNQELFSSLLLFYSIYESYTLTNELKSEREQEGTRNADTLKIANGARNTTGFALYQESESVV
jgi:hypothetical protein